MISFKKCSLNVLPLVWPDENSIPINNILLPILHHKQVNNHILSYFSPVHINLQFHTMGIYDGLVKSQNPPEYAIFRHPGNGAG